MLIAIDKLLQAGYMPTENGTQGSNIQKKCTVPKPRSFCYPASFTLINIEILNTIVFYYAERTECSIITILHALRLFFFNDWQIATFLPTSSKG